jgi:hypothetical protein
MVIREPDAGFLLRMHRPNNKQICLCGCKFTACYVNIKVGLALPLIVLSAARIFQPAGGW